MSPVFFSPLAVGTASFSTCVFMAPKTKARAAQPEDVPDAFERMRDGHGSRSLIVLDDA